MTVETLEKTSPDNVQLDFTSENNGKPIWIESDLDFIQTLGKRGGESFIKCFQCGTCSATCTITPDRAPFPRKEMIWAAWGMKDRLIKDPDIWLCYQCNDCSERCPRGAQPGDILAAVRQESINHFAAPRFLARWAGQPQAAPLLLGIPAALLGLALYLKEPIESRLGITHLTDEITYSYSSVFPHWLLNSFFLIITLLVILAMTVGVMRIWKGMKEGGESIGLGKPTKSLGASILITLKSIVFHDNFNKCKTAHSRYISHMCVFFGFAALTVVTLWVITSSINPLIRGNFIYPFNFWSPWKILANLGGAAVIVGCLLMLKERMLKMDEAGTSSYFDWTFLATVLLVALTGFATEILHYARLEPHRHIIYFVHLVFVCALLMYLPYSKFAHAVYRTAAMVFAEYTGRNDSPPVVDRVPGSKSEEKEVEAAV